MKKKTKKTKNHLKFKKKYFVDRDGDKHAPFKLYLSYDGFDSGLDMKLDELAKRNSGEETSSGSGFGERDLDYDFFTEKGLNQFINKVRTRYRKSHGLYINSVQKAHIGIEWEDLDL
jgi:hypothetical protein